MITLKKVLGAALVVTLAASAASADKERIAFPADYQTKMQNYLSLDRTQNDDQVIRLFATEETLKAAKSAAELPNGTVLVAEIYKAKKDKDGKVIVSSLGRRIRDKLAAIAVMQKGEGWGAKFPEELRNGDWDFAIFSPGGERLVTKDLNSCRACHAPLKGTQHLFSLEHMK
jgi:glucose/arabinose dehydrogenase